MEAARTSKDVQHSKAILASDDVSTRKKRTRHLTLFRVSKIKKKNSARKNKNEKSCDSSTKTTTNNDNGRERHRQRISSSKGCQQHQDTFNPKHQQKHLKGGRLFGSFLLSRGWNGKSKSGQEDNILKSTTTETSKSQEQERDAISTSITWKLPPAPSSSSSSPYDMNEKEKVLFPLQSLLHTDGAVIIPDRPRSTCYEPTTKTRVGDTKGKKQSNVVRQTLCRMMAVMVVGTFLILVSLGGGGDGWQNDSSILLPNDMLKGNLNTVEKQVSKNPTWSSSSSLLTVKRGEEEEEKEKHTSIFEAAPTKNNFHSEESLEEVLSMSQESDSSMGFCKSVESTMMAPIESFRLLDGDGMAEIEEKELIEYEREDGIAKDESGSEIDTKVPSRHEGRREYVSGIDEAKEAKINVDNATFFWMLWTYFCVRAPNEAMSKGKPPCMSHNENGATLESQSASSDVHHSPSKDTPDGNDSSLSDFDHGSVPAFDGVVVEDDSNVLEQNLSEKRSSTSEKKETQRTKDRLSVLAFLFYTCLFLLVFSFLHRSVSAVKSGTDPTKPPRTDETSRSRPTTPPVVTGPPLEILLPKSCQAVEEGPDPRRMHPHFSEATRFHEDQEQVVMTGKGRDLEATKVEITIEKVEESTEEAISATEEIASVATDDAATWG